MQPCPDHNTNYDIILHLFDRENHNLWLHNLFLVPKEMQTLFENHPEWDPNDPVLTSVAACKIVQRARIGLGVPSRGSFSDRVAANMAELLASLVEPNAKKTKR
ncbi:MAG: hypothetical protein CMI16_03075 [Opitutaceae bacterium]|nr:hypothetical protein [Opitutaceae bacterium]|tara:strand:- start:219 stop:530 length:312 start_codon:yes stop_codon:yes gene_type:complete